MFPIPAELPHRIFISKQVPVYSPSASTSATVLDMMTLCLLPCHPSLPGDTARYIQPCPGDGISGWAVLLATQICLKHSGSQNTQDLLLCTCCSFSCQPSSFNQFAA